MPSSEKRIAASRANGAKSKGAITTAGKRNSSRNATRHGILATTIVLKGESRERFAELLNSLNAEFQPETATERIFIQKMAASHWRLLRLWAVETAGIEHEMRRQADSMVDEDAATRAMLAIRSLGDSSRHSELMSRYEHRLDRQNYRALEGFSRLRQARIARDSDEARRPPVPVARDSDEARRSPVPVARDSDEERRPPVSVAPDEATASEDARAKRPFQPEETTEPAQ